MATTSASIRGAVPVSGSKASIQTFIPKDGRIVPPVLLLEHRVMTEAELRLSYRIERTVYAIFALMLLALAYWRFF